MLLGVASLTILAGTGLAEQGTQWWRWVTAVGLVLLAGAGVLIGIRRPKSRALFVIVIAAAIVAIALFAGLVSH